MQTHISNSTSELYGYITDAEFQKYIMRKNDEHDKGTHIIMPKALMTYAYKKYMTRKQKKVWEEKPKEEQLRCCISCCLATSCSNS
jgi:hypothetical protein